MEIEDKSCKDCIWLSSYMGCIENSAKCTNPSALKSHKWKKHVGDGSRAEKCKYYRKGYND